LPPCAVPKDQKTIQMTITTLRSVFLATLALPAWVAWDPLLSYFTAAFLLALGMGIAIKKAPAEASAVDKIILCGPVFIAMPMAVFGTEHFLFPIFIGRGVPAWIPAHTFWVYLVGTCLILGALSIVVQKHAGLSAGLFGIMLLFFEILIHIPRVVAAPRDRVAWAVALRDLAFSCGALSFAATQTNEWRTKGTHWFIPLARVYIGLAVLCFAAGHLLHPELAPGIPLKTLTPTSIPAHLLWGYLTGVVYIVAGVCLIANKNGRLAATWIGLLVLFLVFIVYVPMMVQNGDIGNGLNPPVDTLMLSGAALCLAGSQRQQPSAWRTT
jgi:uncharacterized membrane protein